MSEFKPVAYRSYAEFFDREFLPNARPTVTWTALQNKSIWR